MNAFPDALRVVYGEGLGQVSEKKYSLALAAGASIEEAHRAARGRSNLEHRRFRSVVKGVVRKAAFGAPRVFDADLAALIIPMDQTGSALADNPLTVVPKRVALEVIADCKGVLPELAKYSRDILTNTPAPHYVMLLENFADADMMSFEDETAMYEAVVRQYIPRGATILLKTHPLSIAPIETAVDARLSGEYAVRVIPQDLGRYPMELWSDLISSCEVISMMSYCGISLAYLYDKSTICPLDFEVVQRFFPERAWDRMRDVALLYHGQLRNLETWDGTSILWKALR